MIQRAQGDCFRRPMDKLEPWIRPEKGSSMDLTLWREAWNDLDAPEDQPDLLSGPPCPKTPSSSFSGRSDLAYSPNLGLHSPFAAACSEATSSRIQPRAVHSPRPRGVGAGCRNGPRGPRSLLDDDRWQAAPLFSDELLVPIVQWRPCYGSG